MKKTAKRITAIIAVLILSALSIGIFVSCTTDDASKKAFTTDVKEVYNIDKVQIFGMDISIAIDQKKSKIILNPDGALTMNFYIAESIIAILNQMDFNDLLGDMPVNVEDIANMYAVELFPGFSLKKAKESFSLIKNALGLSFLGLDIDSAEAKAIIDLLNGDAKYLPANFKIPNGIGLNFTGTYNIRNVETAEKETIRVINVGEYDENGEAYIMMANTTSEENVKEKTLNFKIEFLNLEVNAKK